MLKITYENGATQILNPTMLTDFSEVKWGDVAHTIAAGRNHTWEFIITDNEQQSKKPKSRNRKSNRK